MGGGENGHKDERAEPLLVGTILSFEDAASQVKTANKGEGF